SRNGSASERLALGKGRRTSNPSPSSWRWAVTTPATGRQRVSASNSFGRRGRVRVSAVTAGIEGSLRDVSPWYVQRSPEGRPGRYAGSREGRRCGAARGGSCDGLL